MRVIYFIGSGRNGPIKIGYTSRADGVQGRLSSLQTGNPEQLSVLGVIQGTQKGESQIHRALAKSRLKGEWFERDAALALMETLVNQEVGGPDAGLTDFRVSRLLGTGAWTGPLVLYWEPNGSSMSDDYLPSEKSAVELWREWRRDYVPESGVVQIYWYVKGPNFSEAAPFGNTAPGSPDWFNDFYVHFGHPIDASGNPAEWLSLPVVDKAWNDRRSDKGGFIQELTGWKPSPFQQTMDVDLIYEAWVTESHKTAKGASEREAEQLRLVQPRIGAGLGGDAA